MVTSKKDSAFIKVPPCPGVLTAAQGLGRGRRVGGGGRAGAGGDRTWALQKAESEELEVQKPQVKLRRAVSEVARPASTPPIMASAIKDEDDEDRIIAELEVGDWGAPSPGQGGKEGGGTVGSLAGSFLPCQMEWGPPPLPQRLESRESCCFGFRARTGHA